MRNRKTAMPFFTLALIALVAALSLSAVAAGGFQKGRSYADAGFTDVESSQWYAGEVASAYELSLMNGKGAGLFDPTGTVTVAEAVALAARMNSLYNGDDGQFTQGNPWYQVYVEYATEKGILKDISFDSFTRNIKRYEMVQLFANALPSEAFVAKNDVTAIPDVSSGATYYSAVLKFYNAGVVMGNDAYGSFLPGSDIKRSEVAAIVNRIALPENRLARTLLKRDGKSAYYLIDDKSPITSGWSIDSRGGVPGKSQNTQSLTDISKEYGVAFIRDLPFTTSGSITLRTNFSIVGGSDGLFYRFTDSDGKIAYQLYTDNGVFNVLGPNGAAKPLDLAVERKSYQLKITVDLDTKTSTTIINSVDYGTSPLADAVKDIAQYKIGTSDEDLVSVVPGISKLYANYTVNEQFNQLAASGLPLGWQVQKSADTATVSVSGEEAVFALAAGDKATLSTSFAPLSGVVAFESIFYAKEITDGISLSLSGGGNTAVNFTTLGGKFYANGTALYSFSPNVWYTVRMEADTANKKAIIKINHKIMGTVDFAADAASFDNISFTVDAKAAASVRLDDVFVYTIPPEPANYVPAPVPAPSDDYYVGINICSLWRNGQHTGWDAISPFDELKPLLGFYDDGLVEVADWEIKFMVEHGIDFQLFCWYSSTSNTPVKTTRLSEAMLYGYMNAKYSDQMKFALLWEAANGGHPAGSQAFRENFVPYWVEYFFKDNRYMVIDNKPVIAVFGSGQLIKDFGSEAGVAAEFDYVREVCRSIGFDGAIFMACSGSTDEASLTKLKNSGFDAIYAYNWGNPGYAASVNIQNIQKQQEKNIIDVVPTLSTGFNSVGWHDTRFPNMSISDFDKVTDWFKSTALKKYSAGSWQSKFVMLSTWNEYGEGTYMMPAGLNGFGYMDAVRRAFTNAPANHKDDAPDADQITRLGYLYPQYRATLKPLRTVKETPVTSTVHKWDFANMAAEWNPGNIAKSEIKDGIYYGEPSNGDPLFTTKSVPALDLSGITHIKVTMSASSATTLQIYFKTKDANNWDEAKSYRATLEPGVMQDYIIKVDDNKQWKGMLEALRIDPVGSQIPFQILSVELLQPDFSRIFDIDGVEMKFFTLPVPGKDDMFVPFNPGDGTFSMLSSHYTWDKAAKTLKIFANKNEVTFVMDQASALVNCKATALTNVPYLYDGIPMLPIKFLCDALQFTYDDTAVRFSIATHNAALTQQKSVPFQYEFNLFGDSEGWKLSNCNFDFTDEGTLGGIPIEKENGSSDPILSGPPVDFRAADYGKIVVRMKHASKKEKNWVKIYFKTGAQGMSEKTAVAIPIEQTSNGEYVEYTFDMAANPEWVGNILQLRFDPFDAGGSFAIDYIRVIKN